MTKILSLIIPTYNMEKYLDYCLTSLIIADKELLRQLEVLVVIDGAKDRSSEIAHSYQDRFPDTFIVIDKENGNYGSCINRALKEATGKYIKILDADDSYDTDNLEHYLRYLQSVDVDMVITDYVSVNEARQRRDLFSRMLPEKTILTIEEAVKELTDAPIQMHAVTYKRQNLIDIGYQQTEGISYTDQQWIFLPITTVRTLIYLPIVIYKYLVGREGQTVQRSIQLKSVSHHIRKNRQMLQWYKSLDHSATIDNLLITRLSNSYYFVYFVYLIAGSRSSLDLSELRLVTEEMKEVPQLYNLVLDKPIDRHVSFRFIKNWIDNGMPLRLPDIYSIFSCYINLKETAAQYIMPR